jgi:hypothetical protein
VFTNGRRRVCATATTKWMFRTAILTGLIVSELLTGAGMTAASPAALSFRGRELLRSWIARQDPLGDLRGLGDVLTAGGCGGVGIVAFDRVEDLAQSSGA